MRVLTQDALYDEWARLAAVRITDQATFLRFHVLNDEVSRRRLHHLFCRKLVYAVFKAGKARGAKEVTSVADVQELCDG